MRPSSPTPQGLRPVRHPSKFSPLTQRIRGTIQIQHGVEEVEGKKDREEQVEVEREKRLKEVRPCMTMEMLMTRLRT